MTTTPPKEKASSPQKLDAPQNMHQFKSARPYRARLSAESPLTFSKTPIAYAVPRLCRDGIWTLVVEVCPFSGRRHTHGGGSDAEPSFGDRAPHCSESTAGGYVLVEVRP